MRIVYSKYFDIYSVPNGLNVIVMYRAATEFFRECRYSNIRDLCIRSEACKLEFLLKIGLALMRKVAK